MKKITKFLDSVMGGLKRACIAKAIAVVAVASIAINANAQSIDLANIEGVDGLTGKTFDELKAARVSYDASFPTDKSKIFFLYNVKSGKFLTAGSYWGTHVAIADYGKPMCTVLGLYDSLVSLNLRMEIHTPQGQYVHWMGGTDATDPDNGVYVDRSYSEGYGWLFKEVDKTKHTYKLYTYPDKSNPKVVYYLCSNKGQTDVAKSCEAYSDTYITANNLKGYDEWRFYSYDQIYQLQKDKADKMNKSLELSFKLKAPGFERGNEEITNWKTYTFKDDASSLWRFGLEHMYYKTPKTDKDENYDVNTFRKDASFVYTFDGVEYKADDNVTDDNNRNSKGYRRDLAKYTCASATQVAGMIYQDVEVTLPGTYVVECKGYSTTKKAMLFAGVVDPNSTTNSMYQKHLYKTELNQVSGMTPEEKTALHIDDNNMDYAGKAFLGSNQYINQVSVVVPQEVFTDNPDKTIKIRLGVMIGNYGSTETPTADEWTVFDDFRLLYASKMIDSDLILDQDRDNLDYLVNSSDLFQNKTLHLNKTFVLDKWNTFVLPVNLTRDQVWSTFGGTTRLAKLFNLSETAIEFQSVDLTKLTDEATAIEAYQPYIIFPGKNPDQTPAYTGNVTVNNKVEKVTIAANHYVIPKVSLPLTEDGTANDWSKMNTNKWATNMSVNSIDNKMEAWGTFARTFGPSAEQNTDGTWNLDKITDKGTIIGDRDDLKGCYFFANGKMYHSKNDDTYRPRGLRGFSCWFKPTNNNNNTPSSVKLTLDGVTQSGTTGIEDILADYEQPVSRFANGIYNLNGQLVKQGNSTAGLPSGMYIVNGKKCIVR